jgi:hypothetical protein
VTCHLLATIGWAWASARWWGGAWRAQGIGASKSWQGEAPEAAEWSLAPTAGLEEAATGREAKPTGPMDVHELIGEGGPAQRRITQAGRVDRFCGSRLFWI